MSSFVVAVNDDEDDGEEEEEEQEKKKKEKEKEDEDMLREKSNNPNLKGGEKQNLTKGVRKKNLDVHGF